VTESNSPVIRINEISGLQQTPEKTIKDCDIKCVEALNYILKKWNLEAILPIKLVHKEKATAGVHYMVYEAPNIVTTQMNFCNIFITIRKTLKPDTEF
jgi:hypothetical protein